MRELADVQAGRLEEILAVRSHGVVGLLRVLAGAWEKHHLQPAR